MTFCDHSGEVLRQLDRQRKEEIFTDVIVKIADQSFVAHRAVLAANSSTFMEKIQNETFSGGVLLVFLTGVDCNAFEILLDYFYGGKLKITGENVEEVEQVARFLNVHNVSNICSQHLLQATSKESTPHNDGGKVVVETTTEDDIPDTQHKQQNGSCTATEVEILRSGDVLKVEITQTDDCDVTHDQVDDVIPPTFHRSTNNFSCGVCLKTFASAHNLKVHNRKHTGERPFKCEKCDKKFSDPSVFTKHRNMHEGKRPFSCSQCNKKFATIAHKREHMRSHTKEKPFICEVCEKSFRYRGDLTRHLREHNGRMYGPCKFCGKKFTHSGNYKVHVKTHERNHQQEQQQRNGEGRMQRFEAVFVSSDAQAFLAAGDYDVINVIEDDTNLS